MIEDFLLVKVNFGSSASIVSISQPFTDFFDTLVAQIAHRNPNAIRETGR